MRTLLSSLFLTACFAAAEASSAPLTIEGLRCEHAVDPLGIETVAPRLSWKLAASDAADRSQKQTAYQIAVSTDAAALSADKGDVWDSGKVASADSHLVAYAGRALRSHELFYWKVRVWDRDGKPSAWSAPARWMMGMLDPAEWRGQWITGPDAKMRTPLLRREFAVARPVRRAWLYSSALGDYTINLGGRMVSTDCHTPGWTAYNKRVQYQTSEVTSLLHTGKNVVGAQLAPGWFAGSLAWFGPNHYGKAPALFAELHIEYTDGTREVIATDTTWKTSAGAVREADNLDGETYDARQEPSGWDQPGFDDGQWLPAVLTSYRPGQLVAQADPPVRVVKEFSPVAVTEPKPGVFVFDLGQNISGVARLKVNGPAGTAVQLRFAELLQKDGTLDTQNLNKAKATDRYTLAGGPAIWAPAFTFHGFRYVEVTGYPGRPGKDAITGLVTVTDVPPTGTFETSSKVVNAIQHMFWWGGRDAFLSIPMDCPQRSERLGWMGDACFYVATAAWNFDMARFYSKWETDIIDAQTKEGKFPNVAPNFLPPGGYGGGWGDAGVVIPWTIWQRYGDTRIIETSLPAMLRWIEFLKGVSVDLIVPTKLAPAGDWCNADKDTPHDLIATAYFAYDALRIAEMSRALGKVDDAKRLEALFSDIAAAFEKAFVTADGHVKSDTQTAYVLALTIGLLPEDLRTKTADLLAADVKARGNRLSTGFVGTQWLWDALSASGHDDLAYALIEQTTYPSFGYIAGMGATTMWEAWNSLNPDGTFAKKRASLNHSAMSSAGDWMYRTIGGIAPDPAAPGFRRFLIAPRPGGTLTSATTRFESPSGPIIVAWKKDAAGVEIEAAVPVNTTATIAVPASNADAVFEGSQAAAKAPGVTFNRMEKGTALFTIGSGRYHFHVVQ